jgi:hypothetical protein
MNARGEDESKGGVNNVFGSSCCHFRAKHELSDMRFTFILSAAGLPQAFWVDVEDDNHV